MEALEDRVRQALRPFRDFPIPGVTFQELSPVLGNPDLFRDVIQWFSDRLDNPDTIAAIDARGFLFAAPVAYSMGLPLVMIRKRGKLPGPVVTAAYESEYAGTSLDMVPGDYGRVVLIDDVVAKGGTATAATDMIESCGGEVTRVLAVLKIAALECLLAPPLAVITEV